MGNQIKELCSDKVEKWSWFSLLKPENKQSLRYGGPCDGQVFAFLSLFRLNF